MRLTAHEPTAFQRVEQRGDAPTSLDESLRDDLWRQRFTGAFDDRESLPGTRRQIADRPPPPRCFALAQRRGASEVQDNLARGPARAWKFGLEMRGLTEGFRAGVRVRVRPVALRDSHQGRRAAPQS